MPGSAEMARADVGYWDIIFVFRLRPSQAATEMVSCGAVRSRRGRPRVRRRRLGAPVMMRDWESPPQGLHCSSLDAL